LKVVVVEALSKVVAAVEASMKVAGEALLKVVETLLKVVAE